LIGTIEVIDAHCHIYPDKIAARATAGTDAFYGTKAVCDGTTGGLDRILQNGRIDKCLVHSVATTAHQVQSINSFIADAVKAHPHHFIGFGALHPESEDILGDLEHLLELGLKGVKLHPDIQRFKLDDYRCLKMYELCEDRGIPMLIHTGDPRYDFSNPNRMKPVLEIYPSLKIIGAHLGGWSLWEEAYEALSPFPNFYVDCSSCFYLDQAKTK
jgi:predicted TIM-barrel fold metal-dependent hydrolase